MKEKITRNYKITGEVEQLNQLEKVFQYMQYLGNIGSSRWIAIYCDGDGSVRLKIDSTFKELEKPKRLDLKSEPKIRWSLDNNLIIDLG